MFQFVKDYINALKARIAAYEKEVADLKAFIESEQPPFEPSNN